MTFQSHSILHATRNLLSQQLKISSSSSAAVLLLRFCNRARASSNLLGLFLRRPPQALTVRRPGQSWFRTLPILWTCASPLLSVLRPSLHLDHSTAQDQHSSILGFHFDTPRDSRYSSDQIGATNSIPLIFGLLPNLLPSSLGLTTSKHHRPTCSAVGPFRKRDLSYRWIDLLVDTSRHLGGVLVCFLTHLRQVSLDDLSQHPAPAYDSPSYSFNSDRESTRDSLAASVLNPPGLERRPLHLSHSGII